MLNGCNEEFYVQIKYFVKRAKNEK